MKEEKKFPFLSFLANVHGVIAIILGIIAIGVPIYFLIDGGGLSELIALYVFLGAGLTAIVMATISEIIYVFLNIEENTRETAKNSALPLQPLTTKFK